MAPIAETDELQRVIAKVQKLYDLAASTNEHEAAAAIAAAEQLLQQYRLTQADLESCDEPELAVEDNDPLEQGGRIPVWKQMLLQSLASHYGCAIWIAREYGNHHISYFRVVGLPSDTQIMRLQYDRIKGQVDRLAEFKGGGRSYLDSYRKGLVATVQKRLIATRKQVEQTATTRAIVKLDERGMEANRKVRELHPDIKETSGPTVRVQIDAYHEGRADGHQINFGEDLPARRS